MDEKMAQKSREDKQFKMILYEKSLVLRVKTISLS